MWIDADAACGTGQRRDPDDCQALQSQASSRHIEIAVLASGIAVDLIPYTAARQVSMTGDALDRVALTGPAGRWVTERSRAGLEFWRSEGGLNGVSPIDLVAAAYVRDPTRSECARVTAWVGDDALLPWLGGGPAQQVAQPTGLPASAAPTAQALHRDVVRVRAEALFP